MTRFEMILIMGSCSFALLIKEGTCDLLCNSPAHDPQRTHDSKSKLRVPRRNKIPPNKNKEKTKRSKTKKPNKLNNSALANELTTYNDH